MVSDGDWQVLTDKHKKRLGTETKGNGIKSSDYRLMGSTKTSLLELSLVVHDRSQVCPDPMTGARYAQVLLTGARCAQVPMTGARCAQAP